ncbi:hypothetical protein GMJAKD_07295 [Candidatus Electrothrix aarhusensis]
MLDWIIENKEWFFSGAGVEMVGVVLTALITVAGWLFWKRRKDDGRKSKAAEPTTYSVKQKHSGSGDNVGRDKIIKG